MIAAIKTYKSIIKKKKKKKRKKEKSLTKECSQQKLASTIEVYISEALRKPYINHDEFVSVNNVLKKYNKMKEEIKNSENIVEYTYKNTGNLLCQL